MKTLGGKKLDTKATSSFTFSETEKDFVALAEDEVTEFSLSTLERVGVRFARAENRSWNGLTYDYEYDAAGRLAKVWENDQLVSEYTYDQNGNRLSHNGVTLPDGTAITYVYDGRNRLIAKTKEGAVEYRLLYAGQLTPVAKVDAAGGILEQYIYGLGVNSPDYIVKGDRKYRLVKDHLGSVRLVVDTPDGAVVKRLDYAVSGMVIGESGDFDLLFGFSGGFRDTDTGLTKFGARWYDPETGRWLEKKPLGFRGGMNFYAYVLNDPLNWLDKTGLYAEVVFWDPAGDFKSSFGHVSVIIDDTAFSWNEDGMLMEWSYFYELRNEFRQGEGIVLGLTREEELDLMTFLMSYSQTSGDYGYITNNCGDPIESWLESQGYPLGVILFPSSLKDAIHDTDLGRETKWH
ncbi:MAG TPA: RHS repeat-associated core domain-containing protein [bacterium]|nr:RHS repeat-associated core domain-containing protein [bacterium]